MDFPGLETNGKPEAGLPPPTLGGRPGVHRDMQVSFNRRLLSASGSGCSCLLWLVEVLHGLDPQGRRLGRGARGELGGQGRRCNALS